MKCGQHCMVCVVCVVCVALGMGGCRSFTSPARSREIGQAGGMTWIDYDSTRRGAFVIPSGTAVRVVSEPAPDVALGVVLDALAKVNYSGVEGSGSVKVTETVTELGKRTQTIMFLREALYRLEQMSVNNALTPDQQLTIYSKVLETSLLLAKADHNAAETKRIEAQQELEKVQLDVMRVRGELHAPERPVEPAPKPR